MTQEEKYKEALLEARAVLEPCLKYSKGKVREALDSIDNELKRFESEEEKIRMALIKLMTVAGENYVMSATGFKKERLLAYLEKEKAQKPISIPTIPTYPANWGCDGTHCTNPQMDCINCPRKTTGGSFSTSSASGTSAATLHGNTSVTDGKPHNPSFTD